MLNIITAILLDILELLQIQKNLKFLMFLKHRVTGLRELGLGVLMIK
jgi:hypothetical protein